MGALMFMASTFAYAANPHYAPELTSDVYWDTHHICLMRVSRIDADAAGRARVRLELVRCFSDSTAERELLARLADLWFWPRRFDKPRLTEGNELVIFRKHGSRSRIVTHKLDVSAVESPLVEALSQIEEIRAGVGGFSRLSEGAFSNNTNVALYCLRRMMERDTDDVDRYTSRLRVLRDDAARDVQVRLLASKLANRLQGEPLDTWQEYRWVQRSFEQSRLEDTSQLRRFMRRLLEFDARRQDNIAFLSRVARDADAPYSLRLVAMGDFHDPRLLGAGNPDAASDVLFDAALSLLEDPGMRVAAAYTLWHLCNRIRATAESEIAEHYQSRASAAIRERLAWETDRIVRFQLESKLRDIERSPASREPELEVPRAREQ
jgi:hypothetical protein